jgi:hypothetical protein
MAAADDLGDGPERTSVRAAPRIAPSTSAAPKTTNARPEGLPPIERSLEPEPAPAPRPAPRAAAPAAAAEPRPAPRSRPAPRPQPAPRVVASVPVPEERRYRQTIHRIDLWTVLKMSVCFYICAMAVTMVAIIALWVIGDAAGVIKSVESFLGDLLQTDDFTFLNADILRGTLLVGAVLVVLEIVLTVIAAAFYNLFAELFGGIEITISEDESAV